MSYGDKPKPIPCSLPTGPKHKWMFVENFVLKTGTVTARGSTWRFSAKGRYACACGQQHIGVTKATAQSTDLRDHIGSAA